MGISFAVTTEESRRGMQPAQVSPPDVDIVIPVHNERLALEGSVRMLHAYLTDTVPFICQITIVDNASTDGTLQIARRLVYELPGVGVMHLPVKGRGRALRTAWLASGASVLAYMDVDLSTDLNALLPLVVPILSGHSELAIGTRLGRGARVMRSRKREVISRAYNSLLRLVLRARFTDAQCGFKAISADVAHELLPLVADQAWFFDTELLVLAQRCGLRIHEVAVDWVEDGDSRVEVVPTALADLRGVARMFVHRPPSGALPSGGLPSGASSSGGLPSGASRSGRLPSGRPAPDSSTLPAPRRPMLAP